jgi:predicted membrane-bound dolichyl-phosphate-mannose-protein mannosyltransferase
MVKLMGTENKLFTNEFFLLLALTALGAALRASWMVNPATGFMVDEVYYVPAALHYLHPLSTHLNQVSSLFTEDRSVYFYVNPEHPPLVKLLIALGVLMFGNNPLGWRFFSTLFGSISTPALYFTSKRLCPKSALFAAALYALYPLDVSMSQIGMLDAPMVCFSILTVLSMVYEKPKLASVFLGLSVASKLPGLTVALPFVYYVLAKNRESFKRGLKQLLKLLALAFLVYLCAFIPLGYYFGVEAVILDQAYMFLVQQYYGTPTGLAQFFSWLVQFSTSFNPTIFMNNPVVTLLSIPAFVYSLFKLRNINALVLAGFYIGSFGLILAASVIRPIYSFYLEDAAPSMILLDAFLLEALLSSKSWKWIGYALLFIALSISGVLIPIFLYPSTAPFVKEITNFRL